MTIRGVIEIPVNPHIRRGPLLGSGLIKKDGQQEHTPITPFFLLHGAPPKMNAKKVDKLEDDEKKE